MALVEVCICTIILIWFFKVFKYFNITIANFYHYLDIINCILIELVCTEAVNIILIYRQNDKKIRYDVVKRDIFL